MIFPERNNINASSIQPYSHFGETKSGKAILGRINSPNTSLEDASRCSLVSLGSTMRSSLSVGTPVDICVYVTDSLEISQCPSLDIELPFYLSLQFSC